MISIILVFSLRISAKPEILSASVYPTKVMPGDVMLVTVAVKGNVNSVVAEMTHELGSDRINLQQSKKRENGSNIYEGSWIVHDTKGETAYKTYISVNGIFGRITTAEVEWFDPTVTHRASQITAGTFGAGDYAFPGSLNITDDLNVEGNLNLTGNLTNNKEIILSQQDSAPTNNTGYGKIYYKTGETVVDSDTKLLLHFDGTDGATSTTDVSPSAHSPVDFNGSAQLDTAQKKFGTASLLLDGTGDFVNLSDSADWDFGSGDFTIDFWVRFNVDPTTAGWLGLFGQWQDSTNYIFVSSESGNVYFRVKSGGTNIIYFAGAGAFPSANTWYHVAIVRYGTAQNNLYVFMDGVSQSLTWYNNLDASESFPDFSGSFLIGRSDDSSQITYLNGWLEEFRVSKGTARWTSNFNVPTSEYADVQSGLIFQFENGTEYTIVPA